MSEKSDEREADACPEWCVGAHSENDEGHVSSTVIVPVVAARGVDGFGAQPVECEITMFQHRESPEEWVYIGWGSTSTHGLGIEVSRESAYRLACALTGFLREIGG